MNKSIKKFIVSILLGLSICFAPTGTFAQTAYNLGPGVGFPNTWTALQSFDAGLDIRYSSTLFDRFSVDSTGALLIKATEKAPTAPTAALAGAGAGNVDNGTHSYKVTFVTAGGETDAGAVSGTVTVADKSSNGKVALSGIPTGSGFVTSRKVYRTEAGNAVTGPWLLLTTISDNTTTTYTDNTADASLTTAIPSANTAIDTRMTMTNNGNFGIGISPLTLLHLSGNPAAISVRDTFDGSTFFFGQAGTSSVLSANRNPNDGTFVLTNRTGPTMVFFSADSDSRFSFYTGAVNNTLGSEVMRLDKNGNLIIYGIKSTTGVRYVCVDTNGTLTSQSVACVGT